MNANTVRGAVQSFRERTAHGSHLEHCFAPWFLQQEYHLSDMKAIEQSSDGNYDFGIDAFHLYYDESSATPSTLILLQAKYTDSLTQIAKGLRDLERSLPEIDIALRGTGTEAIQNKVLINLRAALNRLPEEVRQSLRIDFLLIHLSEEDKVIIANRTRETRHRFVEAIGKFLIYRKCTFRDISPGEFGPNREVIVPPEYVTLILQKSGEFSTGTDSKMYFGIGQLSDLVELYRVRRDHLFSKNVRHFLHSKRNVEKGPAGKMREVLKGICINKSLSPEIFALYHNGITLYSGQVDLLSTGVKLREPFVLNGCQTIKNAFFFRNDPNLREKIDEDAWSHVAVPIRIIETEAQDLVRTITINNNRQNAISVSAFRANDPIQLMLEEKFRAIGIFYERQEGAYTSLEMTSPELLEDEYFNTRGRCVDMVDLGRCLAAAAGEISLAEHPGDLFESDAAYNRCFSAKRLQSIPLLVFLQNLDDVMGTILKKDLNMNQKGGGPKPARLKYYSICLLMRYIAKNKMDDIVREFGGALYGTRQSQFRDEIIRIMRSRDSGIRDELSRRFMTLDSSDVGALNEAFDRIQNVLYLRKSIDPFEVFASVSESDQSQNKK